MRNPIIVILFLFLLLIPFESIAEQYLCIAEQTSGFRYDETIKSWKSATFKTDSKYILRNKKEGEKFFDAEYKLVVTFFGSNSPICICTDDANEYGYVHCNCFPDGGFRFNKNNLRFLFIHSMGYVNVLPEQNKKTDSTSDEPIMQIGKCSPF
jgi:hypothetical protein